MNVVFKSFLFLGIAVAGVYCCSQILFNDSTTKEESSWEFVSDDKSQQPALPTSLASHESEEDGWLRLETSRAEAELAVFEANEPNAVASKLSGLPAITSESQSPIKEKRAPVIRDLPATTTALPPDLPRVVSLPPVQDEVEMEQIAEPATVASLFAESQNAVSNPFVKPQDAASNFRTTNLPAVEETVAESETEGALNVAASSNDNDFVPAETREAGNTSKVVKNQYFGSESAQTAESTPAPSMMESIENQFAGDEAPPAADTEQTDDTEDLSFEPQQTVSVETTSVGRESDFQPAIEDSPRMQELPAPEMPAQVAVQDPEATSQFVATPQVEQAEPPAFQPEIGNTVTRLSASLPAEERALQHIAYGKSLARRGSLFAARQEFLQSLRIITESYDIQTGTRVYTEKLANAWRALTEADDFIAVDTEQQMNMDLTGILETHNTRLIDSNAVAELSPIQAMQTYYAFAADQMMQAVGNSVVASDALHSLGKLLTASARFDVSGKPHDRTKAMVMHQVALSSNPANHLSANELGVLLANHGRWQQALDLFAKSLRIEQTAATWKNLAIAHEQLAIRSGDPQEQREQTELARLAMSEFNAMDTGELSSNAALPTEWSTPQEFGELAAVPEMEGQPAVESAVEVTAEKPVARGLLKNMKDWF